MFFGLWQLLVVVWMFIGIPIFMFVLEWFSLRGTNRRAR